METWGYGRLVMSVFGFVGIWGWEENEEEGSGRERRGWEEMMMRGLGGLGDTRVRAHAHKRFHACVCYV